MQRPVSIRFDEVRAGDVLLEEEGRPLYVEKVQSEGYDGRPLKALWIKPGGILRGWNDQFVGLLHRPYELDKKWYNLLGELWTVIRNVEKFLAQTAGRVDPEYMQQLEKHMRLLREAQDAYELGKPEEGLDELRVVEPPFPVSFRVGDRHGIYFGNS